MPSIIAPEETETLAILPSAEETKEILAPEETIEVIDSISGTEIYESISATATMQAVSATLPAIIVSPTFAPTATVGGMPLRYVQGLVRYQNRSIGLNAIRVQAYAQDLTLVSEVFANNDGIYSLAVPADAPFWLTISAEGHLAKHLYFEQDSPLAELVLLAGDVNQDGCITRDDIVALQNWFNTANYTSDFNGDGISDMADLAMLAGNFDSNCQIDLASATPSPELIVPEITPELMATIVIPTETPIENEDQAVPLEAISGTDTTIMDANSQITSEQAE
jgi:hypothetical protein